jgi:hypothetical protein
VSASDGKLLYIFSSGINSLRDYQEWFRTNAERFEKSAPSGWRFKGTYIPVFGFGPRLSEIHWELDDYSAFDAAHAVTREGGEFQELIGEMFRFVEQNHAGARLLKHAGHPETIVVEP